MSPRHLIWLLALWPAGASAANWSLSVSGGLATLGSEGEQPFVAADVYRYFGAGFVHAGFSWFDGKGEPNAADP